MDMQPPHLRSSQNGRLSSNMGQQQQPKTQQAQGQQQVDAPSQSSSWSAKRAILWVCKGWWNSAMWWLCFACALLVWCLAYAKEDDGGDIAGTLQFCQYFVRVSFCTQPCDFASPLQLTIGLGRRRLCRHASHDWPVLEVLLVPGAV